MPFLSLPTFTQDSVASHQLHCHGPCQASSCPFVFPNIKTTVRSY